MIIVAAVENQTTSDRNGSEVVFEWRLVGTAHDQEMLNTQTHVGNSPHISARSIATSIPAELFH
eukprot:1143121-Amphidinium_carterae.1